MPSLVSQRQRVFPASEIAATWLPRNAYPSASVIMLGVSCVYPVRVEITVTSDLAPSDRFWWMRSLTSPVPVILRDSVIAVPLNAFPNSVTLFTDSLGLACIPRSVDVSVDRVIVIPLGGSLAFATGASRWVIQCPIPADEIIEAFLVTRGTV